MMRQIPAKLERAKELREAEILKYEKDFARKVAVIVKNDHDLYKEKGWTMPKVLDKLNQIVEIRDAQLAKLRRLDATVVIGTANMSSLRAFPEEQMDALEAMAERRGQMKILEE